MKLLQNSDLPFDEAVCELRVLYHPNPGNGSLMEKTTRKGLISRYVPSSDTRNLLIAAKACA